MHKNPKNSLFSLVGQWALFTRFGQAPTSASCERLDCCCIPQVEIMLDSCFVVPRHCALLHLQEPIAPPRWINSSGGSIFPFLDFWPIRPIKKINGASPQPPNTHWKPFNLIWAFFEWLEDEILKISDFWKKADPHFSKSRKKWCFENAPHLYGSNFSKTRKKRGLKKSRFLSNSPDPKSHF